MRLYCRKKKFEGCEHAQARTVLVKMKRDESGSLGAAPKISNLIAAWPLAELVGESVARKVPSAAAPHPTCAWSTSSMVLTW